MVGCKEAVVDNGRTPVLAIANETAIMVAFSTLKTAIKLTVADHGFTVVAQTSNEATIGIIGAIDGHRRAAVLNSDMAAIEHVAYQSARILTRA